jgi:hypothetical protein
LSEFRATNGDLTAAVASAEPSTGSTGINASVADDCEETVAFAGLVNGVINRSHGSAFQGCGVAQSDRESIRRGEFMTRGDVVLTRSAAPLADQSAHPADIGAGEAVASSTVDLAASPIVGRVCLLKQFSRSSFHIDTPLLLCFGAIYDRNYIVSLDQLSCQAKKAPVPKIFEEKAKGTNVCSN